MKKEAIYEVPLNRAYMYSLYDSERAVIFSESEKKPYRYRYYDDQNRLIREDSFTDGRLQMTHERKYATENDSIIEETITFIETGSIETIQYLYEGDKIEVVKRLEGDFTSKLEKTLWSDGSVKHEIEVDQDGTVTFETKYDENKNLLYKKEMNAEFFYTYNDDGKLVLKRQYTGGGNEIREEITYSGDKINEILFYEDDKKIAREIHTYNDEKGLIRIIAEDGDGNPLEEEVRKIDAEGKPLLLEVYAYVGKNMSIQQKQEYNYDSEGRLINALAEYKTYRDNLESAMVEIKYDEKGSIHEVLTSNRIYNEFDRDAYYLIEEC